MSRPSLSIDLGAAFTKVAFRPKPAAPTHLLTHPDLHLGEVRFCIPSIAARHIPTDTWVFGMEAMDYRPDENIEVFRNWKADLFTENEDVSVWTGMLEDASPEIANFLRSTYPYLQAREVAARFLRWLHDDFIPEMMGSKLPPDLEVQICVPEFVIHGPLGSQMEHLMEEAGFENWGCFCVSEPKANLIGILTGGRNAVTIDRSGREKPDLAKIFGGTSIIQYLSSGQSVVFIDVGAFTTDLALTSLAHGEDSGFSGDTAYSAPLGIHHLDKMVINEMAGDMKHLMKRLKSSAWERLHVSVYGDERHFRDSLESYPIEYGKDLPLSTVAHCIDRFSIGVSETLLKFLAQNREGPVEVAVLTGGGNNLPHIANRLAAQLAEVGVTTIYAPERTTVPAGVIKHVLSQELVRGASGIGGASVLFAKA